MICRFVEGGLTTEHLDVWLREIDDVAEMTPVRGRAVFPNPRDYIDGAENDTTEEV